MTMTESKVDDKDKRWSRHIFQCRNGTTGVHLFFQQSPRPRPFLSPPLALLLLLPPAVSVTTPYVGRSIPDEMEYRYAEHPEGSVANIEKFLPERKKKGSERENERAREERGRKSGRVMESFAFLENIIDRLELIGQRDNWPGAGRARLLLLEFTLRATAACAAARREKIADLGATRRENSA